MDYRRLGRTDLSVSSICLGTMTFGEQNTEAEGHAQMDLAFDRGVNFFDTAELYPIQPNKETQGRTERIIGTWLKRHGNRDKVVVATKVIGRSERTWFRKDGSEGRLTRGQIEEAVDQSLRNLQTDYIDLYQVHWPDRNVPDFGSNPTQWMDVEPAADEVAIEATLEALADLVKAGKVRHIGLSNETSWGTMTYLKLAETRGWPRVVSIQNAYNLLNRTFDVNLAEVALRENVGLLAYSALGQGYLTGKYQNGALPKGARKTLFKNLQRYEKAGTAEAIDDYLALARELGLDVAQMAIAFVLSRSFTTSVIIGATNQDQLETDLGAVDLEITEDIEARINAIHQLRGNPAP